jgi:hypothetical protein
MTGAFSTQNKEERCVDNFLWKNWSGYYDYLITDNSIILK